jgi:phage head maturation protease
MNPSGTERLHEYWAHGEGAAKIGWGAPGDFDRCVMHLSKYVSDPKGLCANLHHSALGVWPGQEDGGKGRSMAEAKKPYGDVPYADPGYLDADGEQVSKSGKPGVKRYPLDAARIMSAWSYINQEDNASQYTPAQLALIKGRVKAAMAEHGHKVMQSNSATHAPDIDVVRSGGGMELHPGGGALGTLTGRFSEFSRWYPVSSVLEGDFMERVNPGSTADTIRDGRGAMRVLFDHGQDRQIGNKVLGPIDVLEERADGPYYEVPLFDTSYNRDLLPGLKAGVYGASMRMRVTADQWNDTPVRSAANPDGIPERTITSMQVLEFGPVTFPANPGASAGIRSGTDEFYFRLREINAPAFEEAVRASGRSLEYIDKLPVIGRPQAGARAASDREGGAGQRPPQSLEDRFRGDSDALALLRPLRRT